MTAEVPALNAFRLRPTSRAGRLLSFAEPLLLAIAVFLLLYQFLASQVEGDQAYYLYAAGKVLDGVQLDGPRLIETNPPLIVWFNTIPAELGRLLHVGPVLGLRLLVIAMLAGSALWLGRIFRRAGLVPYYGASAVHLLWMATWVITLAIQPGEFGQREQLLAALLLPYIFAVGTSVSDRMGMAERIGLGLAAGLAVCFKPHHLLVIICMELFLLLYRRSARHLISPELLASVAAGVAYVVAIRLITPQYYTSLMPLLTSTYWALGRASLEEMVLHVGAGLTVCCLVGSATWLALRGRLAQPQATGTLLAAAIGATGAYFIQHTGWYHQAFPALVFFRIAAIWLLVEGLRLWRPGELRFPRAHPAVWAVAMLCAVGAFVAADRRAHRLAARTGTLPAELASLPRGTTVYAFTVGLTQFPVVLDHGLQWGSRFHHLWMMPAIRENEVPPAHPDGQFHRLTPARLAELENIQRNELTEDLQRTQPAVIYVERCDDTHICDAYSAPFDAVAWFSQNPAFAQLWSGYQLQKRLPAFDVYVRR